MSRARFRALPFFLMDRLMHRRALARWPAWICALALAGPAAAQDAAASAAAADVPSPPPAYRVDGLIEVEMPRSASVRVGVDPDTISLDHVTGIVRYVVVARGPSSVNASYEGIRCKTGEFRVYARQTQGGEWTSGGDAGWRPMFGQSGVLVQHPAWLARNGMCMGPSLQQTAGDMVRELKTGLSSLYD